MPGDPVNLVLTGTLQQLKAAFELAGWSETDRLGLASSWRMVRAFVFNSPYPTAPFSTLLRRQFGPKSTTISKSFAGNQN